MPRNSQGLYTLPAGNPVVPNTLIEANWANPTMDDIAAALTGSLPRDGSAPMTGLLTLSADAPTQPRHAISKGYLEQFLAYATGMPIGSVVAYAGASVPSGYFECNGQAVSRTTYADLFATIGTIYGAGDASTTFNVPDMRDEFIRGKSAARAVGSKQAGSFASHTHTSSDPGHLHSVWQSAHGHVIGTGSHSHGVNDPGHAHSTVVSATPGSGFAYGAGNVANGSTGASGTGISIQEYGNLGGNTDSQQPAVAMNAVQTGIVIGGTGGTETVPQNTAQIYIIKAVNDSTSGGGGGGTGTLTGVTSSDPNMIAIDNTDPAVPLLDIQSNVAFGIPQLDVDGKLPAAQLPSSGVRIAVTADQTFYVRTDGNDANDGLTNTAGGAFLTIQKAFDVLATLDGHGFNAVVQLGDGTYAGSVVTKPCVGFAKITLQGNVATPSNVVITSSGTTFAHNNPSFDMVVKDLSITSSGLTGLQSSNNAYVAIDNIISGATAAGGQQLSVFNNARISPIGNYKISAGSGTHINLASGGLISGNSKTVTLTGTPAFSVSFIYLSACGISQMHGFTYSGSATGKRYNVLSNAVCSTNGGGANYFPGDVAGTTDGFGVYS
jgi:microcystin-dependent protein